MAELKSAKQQLAEMQKKMQELEKQAALEEAQTKLGDVTELFISQEKVLGLVNKYPKDEMKIILKNLFTSQEFTDCFAKAIQGSNAELVKLRAKKQARKEARQNKVNKSEQEQFQSVNNDMM